MAMIGEILVSKGYITQQQLDGVLAVKGPDAQVGEVLIQWGLLTKEQLMEALEIQAPPPPVQPVYQPPVQPVTPDLSRDVLLKSKYIKTGTLWMLKFDWFISSLLLKSPAYLSLVIFTVGFTRITGGLSKF